VLKSFQS